MGELNPFSVRRAMPDDIEELTAIIPGIVSENSILPPHPEMIDEFLRRCVGRHGGCMAGVIDGDDGRIAATIGMVQAMEWYSPVSYWNIIWCGLAPSARKVDKSVPVDDPRRHYGKKLLEFAEWFRAGIEAHAGHPILFRFDCLTTGDMEPKMRWFSRGLTQVGGFFALGAKGNYRPQWGNSEELVA